MEGGKGYQWEEKLAKKKGKDHREKCCKGNGGLDPGNFYSGNNNICLQLPSFFVVCNFRGAS